MWHIGRRKLYAWLYNHNQLAKFYGIYNDNELQAMPSDALLGFEYYQRAIKREIMRAMQREIIRLLLKFIFSQKIWMTKRMNPWMNDIYLDMNSQYIWTFMHFRTQENIEKNPDEYYVRHKQMERYLVSKISKSI